MTINATNFERLLSEANLEQLFIEELGWNRAQRPPQGINVDDRTFELTAIAEKHDVFIFLCSPDAQGSIPAYPVQLKIEREVTRIAHEHLLIFANADKTTLTWLWVLRSPGKPISPRTHTWHKDTSGESLRQKLEAIVWKLEEEEDIMLTDVTTGLRSAFDRDKVSKKFYDRFKAEHQVFSKFVEGLKDITHREWYASLMLNRMMFVYFIQRKGFLDDNINYLTDKLKTVRDQKGKDQFHSFYRTFLRRLFHEGLGTPEDERTADFAQLVGKVPYLNGGLFDLHLLEQSNKDIDIPDEAFERLFAFFDEYDWHLDDRPLKKDNEINPDVLGYIFEKYINQKQMGAYYTKEDITEYIGQNTVIPCLLEQARQRCKVAFDGDESVWNLLQDDPVRYIYSAMKTGVIDAAGEVVPESALPDFVQAGMNDANARMADKRYNLDEASFQTGDGEPGALPTETWREYVARRKRCLEIRQKLAAGEIKSTDDLITHNLDIQQFMQDIIVTSAGPQLLRAIWQAIVGRVPEKSNQHFRHGISILDPTCGSGAFLFAALNILEPLYETCLDRMEGFIEDAGKLGKKPEADFVRILEEVNSHPSRPYFVYKSIILHNLYGVDIMAEAAEICKLRLFLKLVSQVRTTDDLEPLPDIDFNIRTGNALVGFATEKQFDESGDLLPSGKEKIKTDIADAADIFNRFREQQTALGGKVTSEDKDELRTTLDNLSLKLNRYLAQEYGKDSSFDSWRKSHQPFHWFAEFYGVMREGGFDVVIGNPPYVNSRKVDYFVKDYKTKLCPDIYAWCLERVIDIAGPNARTGMIVPLSLSFNRRFGKLRDSLHERYSRNWFSHFSRRPTTLFSGVSIRHTIHLGSVAGQGNIQYTSRLHRWGIKARDHLFTTLSYASYNRKLWDGRIPKVNTQELIRAFQHLIGTRRTLEAAVNQSGAPYELHFRNVAMYFLSFTHQQAPCFDANGRQIPHTGYNTIYFNSKDARDIAFLALNGKIGYAFWIAIGDDFHVTQQFSSSFPWNPNHLPSDVRQQLLALVPELKKAVKKEIQFEQNAGLRVGNYNLVKCRNITDKSDAIIAKHLGFDAVWDDIELFYTQTASRANIESSEDNET